MENKIEPKILKGFRDFLPDEMLERNRMLKCIAEVFETSGFVPISTPAMEYSEILLGKYGDEGDRLLYRFTDNGERDVSLRYDLTVPLARFYAMYRDLPVPFKRYHIADVWRAEKPGRGRFREFMQCDVDIVGSSSLSADAEVIAAGCAALDALRVKNYKVHINNRTLLNSLLKETGITEIKKQNAVLRIIDKFDKLSENDLKNELALYEATEILNYLHSADLRKFDGFKEIENLIDILKKHYQLEGKVSFEPALARGLDYYTGIIYETRLTDLANFGSVMSGGRYDGLIGMFSGEPVPAVGISIGIDRLFAGLAELNLIQKRKTMTSVLVTVFPETKDTCMEIALRLRENHIPAEIYLDDSHRLSRQFSYANRLGIRFCLIIGSDEEKQGKVSVKDMTKGEQTVIDQTELIDFIKKNN
jgi:histidyl-tRNA synthetase